MAGCSSSPLRRTYDRVSRAIETGHLRLPGKGRYFIFAGFLFRQEGHDQDDYRLISWRPRDRYQTRVIYDRVATRTF